jgi:hypothetical protein
MTTVGGASFRNCGNGRVGVGMTRVGLGAAKIARRTCLTGFSAEVMSRFDASMPKIENDPSLERACGLDRAVEYVRLVRFELSDRRITLRIESEKNKERFLENLTVYGKIYTVIFPGNEIAAKVFKGELIRLIQEYSENGLDAYESLSKWENNMLQIAACARLLELEDNVSEEIMEYVYLGCFRFRNDCPSVKDAYARFGRENLSHESEEAYLTRLCLDAIDSFVSQDLLKKASEFF